MIYETGINQFSISSHGVWLPGIYDSKRSANYAFRFSYELLKSISDVICTFDGENREITFYDLKKWTKTKEK